MMMMFLSIFLSFFLSLLMFLTMILNLYIFEFNSGYGPCPLDIAPKFAGALIALSNTAGTIPGIISPSITGRVFIFDINKVCNFFLVFLFIYLFYSFFFFCFFLICLLSFRCHPR